MGMMLSAEIKRSWNPRFARLIISSVMLQWRYKVIIKCNFAESRGMPDSWTAAHALFAISSLIVALVRPFNADVTIHYL